jgi:hypothetical protein
MSMITFLISIGPDTLIVKGIDVIFSVIRWIGINIKVVLMHVHH